MLTLLALFILGAVFFKTLGFALRLGWGIFRIVGFLVFLPVILVVMIFGGLIWVALPVMAVFWIIGKLVNV